MIRRKEFFKRMELSENYLLKLMDALVKVSKKEDSVVMNTCFGILEIDKGNKIYLVVAAVGYYNNKREHLKRRKDKKDIFSKSNFDKNTDIRFFYVLVLAEKRSKEAFQGDVLSIVKEYANDRIRIPAKKFENMGKLQEAI